MLASTTLVFPRYIHLESIEKHESGLFKMNLWKGDNWKKTLSLDEDTLKVLKAFFQPQLVADVAKSLKFSVEQVYEICEQLLEAEVLKAVATVDSDLARYDRHLLFYDLIGAQATEVQKRISNSKVALLGIGGIGNWVASGLIGAGFKELRLLDFDTIELSNLTRQILFAESDIGKSKVEVAAKRLQAMNSQTFVNYIPFQAKDVAGLETHLKDIDFLIFSADKPAEVYNWVDAACLNLKIPYINAGYRNGIGVVGPLTVHGITACYKCFQSEHSSLFEDTELTAIKAEFCERIQAPSFGPINAIVSAITVLEVTKYLGKFGECPSLGYEININPMTLELSFIGYRKDSNCQRCGAKQNLDYKL
jgi:molybdopterin-synthase adenylyltransferase